MVSHKLLYASAFLLGLITHPATATTYCVDPDWVSVTSGCNVMLKTVAEVNALDASQLAGGDNVLFLRGVTWHEELIIDVSGNTISEVPITFGAYGDPQDTNPVLSWDMNRLSSWNNGFERLESGSSVNDTISDLLPDIGELGISGGSQLLAVTGTPYGNNAIKLYTATGGGKATIRFNNIPFFKPQTDYYFELSAKIDDIASADGLRVRIKDIYSGKYLQDDLATWGTLNTIDTEFQNITTNWQAHGLTFTTDALTGSNNDVKLYFDIIANNTEAIVYVDDIYVYEYDAEGNGRQKNSDRTGTEETRNISINASVKHIIIDSIDVTGPNIDGNHYNLGGGGTATFLIKSGGQDITVRDLTVSYSAGVGIWALDNTSKIYYERLTAYGNNNTAIYSNASTGSIKYCTSTGNGLSGLSGDEGSISLLRAGTPGEIFEVIGNVSGNNGAIDNDADHEISVVSANGPLLIRGNYLYNCIQGCIQVVNGGHGSEISYNVLSGFGETTGTASPFGRASSKGKWGGIRIGAGGGTGNVGATNVRILNNVLTGGAQLPDESVTYSETHAGIYIGRFDTTGAVVKNNIVFGNAGASVWVATSGGNFPAIAGYDFSNNLYEVGSAKLHWNGVDYATLGEWRNAADADGFANFDNGTLDSDPLFVNATTDDFHLATSSPAIDAGVNVGLTEDKNGIPISGNPDIGAFEFTNDNDQDGVPNSIDNCPNDTNPGQTDTDGDGLGDACDDDRDGDGLSNDDEATEGTNPLDPDTDNDGYQDGTEVSLGSDPLDISSIPGIAADGDINLDGKVNAADILLAQRAIFNLTTLTAEQIAHGDYRPAPGGDGQLNLADLILILQAALL